MMRCKIIRDCPECYGNGIKEYGPYNNAKNCEKCEGTGKVSEEVGLEILDGATLCVKKEGKGTKWVKTADNDAVNLSRAKFITIDIVEEGFPILAYFSESHSMLATNYATLEEAQADLKKLLGALGVSNPCGW